MRLPFLSLVFTGLAVSAVIDRRQSRSTETQLEKGPCKKVTLIFARGSTEGGNMGSYVGPYLADGLIREYRSDIAIQGVNYAAGWFTNYIGGDPAGAIEVNRLVNLASTKCPETIMVVSGYSQGGGLMHNSIPKLSSTVKDKIAAIVVFGDTYNVRDKESIPQFPKERFMTICNPTDLVCHDPTGDVPVIMPAHIMYSSEIPKAVAFIKQRVNALQQKHGSSGSSSSSSSSSNSGSAPKPAKGGLSPAKSGPAKGSGIFSAAQKTGASSLVTWSADPAGFDTGETWGSPESPSTAESSSTDQDSTLKAPSTQPTRPTNKPPV